MTFAKFKVLEGLSNTQRDAIGFVAYLILCVIVFVVALTFFSP